MALADGALRDMQVGFAKTSGSEAAVAQMMCELLLLLVIVDAHSWHCLIFHWSYRGKNFVVGKLRCAGCAVVQFYKTHMQYTVM